MEKTLANVMSVYSGVDGKCCCGCAGKHTYASAHVDEGSKNRGYKVNPWEVNDRVVKGVFNKVMKNFSPTNERDYEWPGGVSVVIGTRLHIVYWLPEKK